MNVDNIFIKCDNTSAINIVTSLVYHKHTKHIDVRNHFLRDNIENGFIQIVFCRTEDQVAAIFTKALSRQHFKLNRLYLGLIRET